MFRFLYFLLKNCPKVFIEIVILKDTHFTENSETLDVVYWDYKHKSMIKNGRIYLMIKL